MKPLAVTLGDPSGIGAEVVAKALTGLDVPVWLFGHRRWAEQGASFPAVARFVDVRAEGDLRFGEVSPRYGEVALRSIHAALEAIERGECQGLVTAPIHKRAIAAAGAAHTGHTELLAERAGLRRYAHDHAMYFDSPSIKTSLLSVHLPLRKAIEQIDAGSVTALARLTAREYRRIYGAAPRMAAAGLNPHAGEEGAFGEEETIIAAGVAAARAEGLTIAGPLPADTLFLAARQGRYDVVLAMYHDQGLIAVKTLEFERSVNVTIGLPYLRASVDHGTAFDIAGKDRADPRPMRYAILWTAQHAGRMRS